MSARTRLAAIVVAVVALALSVLGVVLAATDANPAGKVVDHLALNGYPPKTANATLTLTNGTGATLSANVSINFRRNEVGATLDFPLVFTNVAVNALVEHDRLYLRSGEASNGTWYAFKVPTPSLFGLALELTKPDVGLITGLHERVTRAQGSTTYVFTKRDVALTTLVSTKDSLGSLRWSITTGPQGEITVSELALRAGQTTTTLRLVIESYNQPAHLSAPPTAQVKQLSPSLLRQVLKNPALSGFLVPDGLQTAADARAS